MFQMSGPVVVSLAVLPALLSFEPLPQAPIASGRPVGGFVVSVTGHWQVKPGGHLAERGMALPPRAVLKAQAGGASQPEILIALPFGGEVPSCSVAGDGKRTCADRVELPKNVRATGSVAANLAAAFRRMLDGNRRRLVATISRGVLGPKLHSNVVSTDGTHVDLSRLFTEFRGGPQTVKFSSLEGGQRAAFECTVRGPADYSCPVPNLPPANSPRLYRVAVSPDGWSGGALLADSRSFATVAAQYDELARATSGWNSPSDDLNGLREVLLELVAEKFDRQ